MSAWIAFECARWRLRGLVLCGLRRQALDLAQGVLLSHPDDKYTLATCAHLQVERGEQAAALQNLQRLVALQPGQAAAWFNLGFVLEAMGQLPEAETAFGRATAIDPGLDRAWYGLGLCLIRQHRYEDAVAALRKTTELQPMSPCAWYQLARVHVERREPEQAVSIIRHLRGFEPRVADQLQRETGLCPS